MGPQGSTWNHRITASAITSTPTDSAAQVSANTRRFVVSGGSGVAACERWPRGSPRQPASYRSSHASLAATAARSSADEVRSVASFASPSCSSAARLA